MLKVQYMSDLHLEFGGMDVPEVVGDVLVLAGDIGVGTSGVDWINECALQFKDVIYILGNHEFYHQDMPLLINKLRKETQWEPNVHFMHNERKVINGVRFAATTLWADMTSKAFYSMNDSNYISYAGARMGLEKVKGMFHENLLWLQSVAHMTDVVITHHCPHIKSINTSRYPDDSMNSGYYTNVLPKFENTKIQHWICGHTHSAVEYEEFGIKVHNNCRGYVRSYGGIPEVKDFNSKATFELEPSVLEIPSIDSEAMANLLYGSF